MLKNYIKIAFRNLTQNKVYSTINITGLAIGLAVCMLIMLYVGHESNYDRFHDYADKTFWIQGKIKMGSDSIFVGSLSYATAPLVKQEEAAVESFMRYKIQNSSTVIQNPAIPSLKFTEDKFLFADSNFFSFFSFTLSNGSKQQVLREPFNVVISPKAANKYFGNENPVGKIIRYNMTHDFRITGIADRVPSNSSIDFDFVASLSSLKSIPEEKQKTASQTVENGFFTTYFRLKRSEDAPKLEARILQLSLRTTEEQDRNKFSFVATPFTSIHLRANYGDY
jgi:putative ABC transport system permease protein